MKLRSRHPQWEPRLMATVTDWRGRQHETKPGKDCAAFVLACVEAVTGEKLAFELRAYRSVVGQARALRDLGFADLPAAADACFGERIPALCAHRGDVVTDGAVLGVMMAGGAVVFDEEGMLTMARRSIVAAWPIGRADG